MKSKHKKVVVLTRQAFFPTLWVLSCIAPGASYAQDAVRQSLAGEQAAKAASQRFSPDTFTFNWGRAGIQIEAKAETEYTDNAFHGEKTRKDDLILRPEIKLRSFVPISQLNTFTLSLGVGYEHYTINSEVNNSTPLISPDTELAFNLFIGDMRVKFREKFSYQESLSYGYEQTSAGGPYINLNNIARFGRFDNMIGTAVDWDLNRVILSFSYDHQNFFANGSQFDYVDRTSELFSSTATIFLAPRIKTGVETTAGIHDFDSKTRSDGWDFKTGPFVDFAITSELTFRTGAGYDFNEMDQTTASASNLSTYYAYGRINHRLNQYIDHSFSVSRKTEMGISANHRQIIRLMHSINANRLIRNTSLGAGWGILFTKESGGFSEEYDLYYVGLNALYHFSEQWKAYMGYNYLQKESQFALRSFYQNRISIGTIYRF